MTTAEATETPVPELREVRGPSAVGGGWRRFFELLYLISLTEFRRSFYGTILGYLWSLLRPFFLFAVLLFVFTKIIRFTSVPHYAEFLLFNIVLFGFFGEATGNAVTSVTANEGIVRKTQFPRLVIPMSVVLTALFNYGMNLIAVLIFMIALGVHPMWTWLYLPLIVALVAVFSAALAMLLSTLYVRARDVAIIWAVLSTALLYATPVIYPPASAPIGPVPPQYIKFLMVNPLTPIFNQAHSWIIDPTWPGSVSIAGGIVHLLPAAAIYIGVCVLGVWVFNRDAPRVAEEL